MTGLCNDNCIDYWLDLQVGDVLDEKLSNDPVYKYLVGDDLNPDKRTKAIWTTLREFHGPIQVVKDKDQHVLSRV
jgi:hypothetical protein